MLKKVILLVLCICLLGSLNLGTYASTVDNNIESKDLISPYMNYIAQTNIILSKTQSGKASTYCNVRGYPGITTKIEVTTYLEEYRNGAWHNINTYTRTSNSDTLTFSREVSVASGNTYRVTALIRAFSGERSEIVITRSNEVKF